MKRTEVLTKLLALGGLSRDDIRKVTLWPAEDVDSTIATLEMQRVAMRRADGRGGSLYMLQPGSPDPFGRSAV